MQTGGADDDTIVFRSGATVIGTIVFCLTAGGLLVVTARGTPLGWSLGLGLAIFGIAYVRRMGVDAARAGVRVHHQIGSTLIPWGDVERFEIGDRYPWPVWLVTTGGLRIRTVGLQPTLLPSSRAASRSLVSTLNHLVAQHRDGP